LTELEPHEWLVALRCYVNEIELRYGAEAVQDAEQVYRETMRAAA
jgi:hypothetical protein